MVVHIGETRHDECALEISDLGILSDETGEFGGRTDRRDSAVRHRQGFCSRSLGVNGVYLGIRNDQVRTAGLGQRRLHSFRRLMMGSETSIHRFRCEAPWEGRSIDPVTILARADMG